MKFGIVQGRLTNEKKEILQKFPKNWIKEFNILRKTKLAYIELFLENKINKSNPIWTENGQKKLLKHLNNTNLNYYIVCDNYIINKELDNSDLINYYKNLLKKLKTIKCKLLIVPIDNINFLEKNLYKLEKFIFFLKKQSKRNNIKISLEVNISIKVFQKIFLKKKFNKIKITFDTGNFYLMNKNVLENLKNYYPFINHIHLKDRNLSGKNVFFGKGKINFISIFKFLKKKKYNKCITFETNRGVNALETAISNFKLVKNLI